MKNANPLIYLEDIVEYAEKVAFFIEGMDEASFLKDERTILAVIRCFEVIGEAANRIPKEWQQRFHTIPWPQIIAFRNFLIHQYQGVSMGIVWITAKHELPKAKGLLTAMLATLKTKQSS